MKLAIVTPWFGRELKGGAEQHAWQIAARLAARGHNVDVITTCCRSHQDDWAVNHLAPGAERQPERFTIRRFPVDQRNRAAFDPVAGYLMNLSPAELRRGVSPVSAAESQTFVHELIRSEALLQCLRNEKESYDWFVLLPYLYGPVIEGVRIVAERAALQPCLHDEAYAYLPEVAESFYAAAKLLFISEGERELALRLFGPGIALKSALTGGGVEAIDAAAGLPADETRPETDDRYVLYLGRKDAGKNVPMLLRAFARFRAVRPKSKLRLLLAGNGSVDAGELPSGAEDLGLVDEQRKQSLLRNCTALFQPSQNESFSRVIMEAWLNGKPVAVHGDCLATAVAVQQAQGGWLARTEAEWGQRFVDIARLPSEELAQLGSRGRDYASSMANWERVIDRYEEALSAETASPGSTVASGNGTSTAPRYRIHQFLPNLAFGDAISNHALWIRDTLRELGYESDIYVRFIDERVAAECALFSPDVLQETDAVIYHHSLGSEITPHVVRFAGPKCLIYHNITPAEFFFEYRPEFAAILERGRHDLGELATSFSISYGDSAFNAEELREAGFANAETLPICVDPAKWNFPPDKAVMHEFQDGRTNLLFVGRIAPNKKQTDLVRAFARYLGLDPGARLILVGKAEEGDPYAAHLQELIAAEGLTAAVVLPGSVTNAQLAAYYRTAHLLWSMSEHEGFCVPLIEAMWFDVPVLAYRSSAVPESLGAAGLMFTDKQSWRDLAALAHLAATDPLLRTTIRAAQRKRRSDFLPSAVRPQVIHIAQQLTARLPRTRRTLA
jgi:glycosyltransferase involved in cell wall biosynthesis